MSREARQAFLASLTNEEAAALLLDWPFWSREAQRTPPAPWFVWVLMAGRGYGKALDVLTPIPTPTGWTTMGTVCVGDEVFDERGQVCRVTFASPVQVGRPCFDVVFSDGTVITADSEHQWLTWSHIARKADARRREGPRATLRRATCDPSVVTTAMIAASLRHRGREANHAIPVAQPIQCPARALSIDPYLLGLWLGDGASAGATMTSADKEVWEAIEATGHTLGVAKSSGRAETRSVMSRAGTRPRQPDTGRYGGIDGCLSTELRRLNLLGNKHVPAPYLRASEPQRTALLQGLMDTDGSASIHGHVEFCSTRKILADAVLDLARGLGFKPSLVTDRARLNGRDCGPRFRVLFTPYRPVFRLSRKLVRQTLGGKQRSRVARRYIVDVRPVPSVPVRCIQVDSPNALFLASRAYVPTHNTRVGAEWTIEQARTPGIRIALVAKNPADARDVLIEGESGILACSLPGFMPVYEPTKRRLTWPNRTIATTYSAEMPDDLRGPQHHKAWVDEFAKYKYPQETWDNLMFGLRLGDNPQAVVTTTPRPIASLKAILADSATIVTRGSTDENAANLAPSFLREIHKKYEGTRLGRQELHAELLEDVPGALWTHSLIEQTRVRTHPDLVRLVIAIDPAGSSTEDADETGMVAAGLGTDGHGYVLLDVSGRYTPGGWAGKAVSHYELLKADRIVGEVNNGGEMVGHTVRMAAQAEGKTVAYAAVHASRGKQTRAEPIAALYEQCLAAGTLVATAEGQVPIEAIQIGDWVWTRAGLRRVGWSGKTGMSDTIEITAGESTITCTESHPVWSHQRGFIHAGQLAPMRDMLCRWPNIVVLNAKARFRAEMFAAGPVRRNIGGLFACLLGPSWSSMGDGISSKATTTSGPVATMATPCFTGPFGKAQTGPSQMAGISITKTGFLRTTSFPTWKRSPLASIRVNGRRILGRLAQSDAGCERSRKPGGPIASQSRGSVSSAGCGSKVPRLEYASALRPATQPIGISTVRPAARQAVYNLTVEDQPEFFANGILVHNCRVHHVGMLPELEDQMCSWVPGMSSPDRMDALVWALTDLMIDEPEPEKYVPTQCTW